MRILVVEDEPALALRLQQILEAAGFAVDVAYDGEEGWHLGDTESYDAAVLDLGLPKIDGVSILRRWREAGRALPVLILTARGRWSEKMVGFQAGADDYMTKPFEMDEVVYRLRALIRRAAGHAQPELSCGKLRLDSLAGRFTLDGVPLQLTAQEFRILSYFMHHSGQVVSRTELMEHVYDRHFDGDSNVLEVLIGRIRKKLGTPLIGTVRGQGYRLFAETDAPPGNGP